MTLWALLRNYGSPFESGVGVDRRVSFYIYIVHSFIYILHSHSCI